MIIVLKRVDQDHNNFYCLQVTLHSNVLNYEPSKSSLIVLSQESSISKSRSQSSYLFQVFTGLNQKCLFISHFKTFYILANISILATIII
jgi:hypothetical protein